MILNQNSHWGSLPAYSLVFMSKTMTSIANSFCNFEKVILPLRYSILSFVKKMIWVQIRVTKAYSRI